MKKLTALLLALLMLALPVLGMAASPTEMLDAAVDAGRPLITTVSFVPGTLPVEEALATVINDLLNALTVRVSSQQGDAPQNDFALSLSGTDVLTFSAAQKDGTTYVNSSLLGADTVAANAEEGQNLISRIMQMMVDGGAMTQSDADAVKAQLEASLAAVEAPAQSLNDLMNADFNFAGLTEVMTKVLETAKIEEVTAQPKNSDPATTKVTCTATGEDIIALYNGLAQMAKSSPEIMQVLDQFGQIMEGGPVSGAELLDTVMDMFTQTMAKIDTTIEYTFYLNENDIVAALMNVAMVADNKETMTMEGSYARLTMDEQVTHTATLIAQDDAKEGVSISVDVTESENHTAVGVSAAEIADGVTGMPMFFVVYSNDMERAEDSARDAVSVTLVINDEDTQEQVKITVTADTVAAAQDADVALTTDMKLYVNSEEPLLGIKAESVTGVAAPSIVSADAVHPGAMDDAEFNAFLSGVVMALQTNLITLLQNLPASVQQIVMAMMGQ